MDPESKALCPSDVLGEVWVDAPALSGGFWGMKKHTQSIFRARPCLHSPDRPGYPEVLEQEFLRTGMLGCLISGDLVIFGYYEDQVHQLMLLEDDEEGGDEEDETTDDDKEPSSKAGATDEDVDHPDDSESIPEGDLMEPGMRIHFAPDITYTIMTKVSGVSSW